MDAGRPLFAKDPRLVADQNARAGAQSSGKPRRPGVTRLIVLVALVGVGAAAWGIHRAMAARGTLRIKTKPAGAAVEIDGMSATTKWPDDAKWDHDLDGWEVTWSLPMTVHRQPGTYDVSVTADGFKSHAARVVLQAGQITSLDVELGPITDLRLEIASAPTGLSVMLDGSPLKDVANHNEPVKTPVTVYGGIRHGKHRIEIPGDCRYQTFKQEVDLHPGVITRVEARLEPWPFKPSWCTEADWRGK
ncbi:MAG TPA: hypothetical protein VKQ32_11555 [Polyangia bacterium]|nr:hypothetical protein [Polyangia bacterium]